MFALALWPASGLAATPNDVVVSANPVNWTPHVLDGSVTAIVQIGNTMVVGGDFTQVKRPGGPILARTRLFAFDATTGAINPDFAPQLDRGVEALAPGPTGQTVFVGGRFNTVNGEARKGLVQLNLNTGLRVGGFAARPNGAVFDLAVANGKLIVAGNFTKVSGTTRSALAAVDATTGVLDANFNFAYTDPRSTSQTVGSISVNDIAATPDGSRLVTAGNFQRINGLDRNQLAVLNLATTPASVADWATNRYKIQCPALKWPAWIRDVAMSPDGSWFLVATTGAYRSNELCDTATRWEVNQTGSSLSPTWIDYTGGDTLFSAAVTGAAAYVGGHQRWQNNPFRGDGAGAGAVPRSGIAGLDTVNGMPLSWNPGRKPRGLGALALVPTDAGLWVGSDTNYIGGEYHARLALMPTAGGTPLPPATPGSLPGEIYGLGLDNLLRKRTFDGTNAGSQSVVPGGPNDWSHGRGAFMLSGSLYTGWDDGNLYVRSYDGSTFGARTALNLYGLTSSFFPLSSVTGMFFDDARHRLYYTVAGNSALFYRYFTPESGIVGAETFVAAGGSSWSSIEGMTMASGQIYLSRADGNLRRLQFSGGVPVGSETLVSSTGDWRSRGLFVFSPPG